jgi:hypothetical protein
LPGTLSHAIVSKHPAGGALALALGRLSFGVISEDYVNRGNAAFAFVKFLNLFCIHPNVNLGLAGSRLYLGQCCQFITQVFEIGKIASIFSYPSNRSVTASLQTTLIRTPTMEVGYPVNL